MIYSGSVGRLVAYVILVLMIVFAAACLLARTERQGTYQFGTARVGLQEDDPQIAAELAACRLAFAHCSVERDRQGRLGVYGS